METLTLPEPARQLWTAKRDIVHSIQPVMFQVQIRPHLGGGTILAARWQHRVSTDIDIFLPGRNTLIDLVQDNDKNIVAQLGGTPEATSTGHVKIGFEHGKMDLVVLKPDPPFGETRALVDGNPELVLSSAQILRGKLERVDKLLARDVFDMLVAAEADPVALATAANMIDETHTAATQAAWEEHADTLAENAKTDIRGVPTDRYPFDPQTLGRDAAEALRSHRYTSIQVDVDGRDFTIQKNTGAGALPPERYPTKDAARALIQSGIATYLNSNGPMPAPNLLHAIRNASGTKTVFDSADLASVRELVDQRPAGPAPRSPNPVRPGLDYDR